LPWIADPRDATYRVVENVALREMIERPWGLTIDQLDRDHVEGGHIRRRC
jgi:hypothetical protein